MSQERNESGAKRQNRYSSINDTSPCADMNATQYLDMQTIYNELRDSIYSFLPIFIGFVALIILTNLTFLYVVAKKIRLRQLPRKRYYFELNRSFADLIAVCIALSGGAVIATDRYSPDVDMSSYTLLNISIMVMSNSTFISLWALTGCYLAMTILQYVAVTRPLVYTMRITPQKCLLVILACWLLAIIVGPIPELIYSYTQSTYHGVNLLATVYIALLVIMYCVTVTVYLTILYLLRRENNRFQSIRRTRRSKWYGMKKLAVYLTVYSAAFLPMVLLIVVYWRDVGYLFDLLKETTECDFDRALLMVTNLDPDFGVNVKAIGWSYLLWNFRAIWDPVTTVLMEPVLRKWFCSVQQTQTQSTRLRTLSSRVSLFA